MLTGKLSSMRHSTKFKTAYAKKGKSGFSMNNRALHVHGYSNILLKASSKPTHTKLALLGAGVCLSAVALPSPWSWVTFIAGLQLFAPIVGLALRNSGDAERQRIIADIHARLDALDRDILKGDPNETGLTTHNKRIEYNTLARLLEKLSKED